ncbi:B-cell CLL/lymphoma 9-like protein [Brachionichthys hirsutus]|uniref:B-cell CLL/lymphoma 9-like protein n=1 Tax=Brachionichthys hirsutus TaxID=412623 RepID=UPI0036045B29
MLQDKKLANHGKQVTSDSRSLIPSINQQQQGAAGHLGSKAAGARNYGVKTNQISPGNSGMKAVNQSASSVGGMLKNISKRERSLSTDSAESRNAIPAALETDTKGEGVMRSKRRCVLEKKQPYSGDEWCSGPDTEEDEDKLHTAAHRPVGVLTECLSAAPMSQSGGPAIGCGMGPGLKTEAPQPSQQVYYVFTTNLANSAAEAVMKGQTDSILLFHQQNIPCSKLGQNHPSRKLPNLSEKVNLSGSPPAATPKSQSGTPRPASVGVGGSLHPVGTPSSVGHSDNESSQTRPGVATSNNGTIAHRSEEGNAATCADLVAGTGDSEGAGALIHPASAPSPTGSPSILSAHLQSETGQINGPECPDGLSKEQLEHRERSLQTLRDIERLLLRSGPNGGLGNTRGSNSTAGNNSSNLNSNTDRSAILEDSDDGPNNSRNCSSGNMLSSALPGIAGMKRYEEPLQSVITHAQSLHPPSLGGPTLDSPQRDSHQYLPQHPHHQISSPGVDMGQLLGPEGLTADQIAWRKLQEEYYLEKRRQQEIQPHTNPQHLRMMSEMGMHGSPMIMRGPPPPYHSKPGDQQWGPGNMMGGGMGGNARMIDMHLEGPRGPRFLGQMQRGAFPGMSGGVLTVDGLGPQRPNRPGMIWLDDMPNQIGGGGPFHGCYPGGPLQNLQEDPEFHIMEKLQMQRLSAFELDRLAKQQQQERIMDSPGAPDLTSLGMGHGPPPSRAFPMDFRGSREMIESPGRGPQMRDLVNSPLGILAMKMNPQMNVQQQQQMMLSQKLRGGPAGGGPLCDMFSPGAISRIKAAENVRGGNKGMIPGPDVLFQFSSQGPFSGGQVEGPYYQQPDHEMFGPDQQDLSQVRALSRLSHMPMTGGFRDADLSPRHPSDLSINVNPLTSPVPPPLRLKSPCLNQEPSPLLPSPSAPGLKSPSQISSAGHHPPLPPGAGTPSSSSMKSPQVLGSANLVLHSPSASPGHLKSPGMGARSPGWASPKTALQSPGGPPNGKLMGNGRSSSTETGQSLPPRSSNSTPISQPGSMNPSMPFASSPSALPPQNPLSLIMSQMSKYAMPSSTPLYHDAIKTIATSDDEMMPDRPLLAGVSIGGNMGNPHTPNGPHSDPQSPMGILSQGQQHLPHEAPGPLLSSPNNICMSAMNAAMMGGCPPEGIGQCNVSPVSQNQMAGFPRIQHPPHGPMHSPVGEMLQNFSQPNENILSPQQLLRFSKGPPHQRPSHPSNSFASLPIGDGPDLRDVIRHTHTGIPEFDLSRIIPSDKPSSTLQYFPKSEPHQNPHQGPSQQPTPQQLLKQLPLSGPPQSSGTSANTHLAYLQNMMAEQQLSPHPTHGVIRQSVGIPPGGSRAMVSGGGMGSMCPPGHVMTRTGMMPQQQFQQQQAMMANSLLHHPTNQYPGMMPSQQHPHNLMAQQNMMMMQAKQRSMSGDPFGPQGPLISPQGPMMTPSHPESGMMGRQSLRQGGMSLDSPIGYGSGGMANMPF